MTTHPPPEPRAKTKNKMTTLTAPEHATAEAEVRKRAANRHRNADELWHLFSRTHDPVQAARIATEAGNEDRAAAQLTEAANYHADQAASKEPPSTENQPS